MDVNEILEQYIDSPEDLKEILKDEAPSKIKELSNDVGQALKEIIDDEDNETMLDIYKDMQQRFKNVFKSLLGNASDKVEAVRDRIVAETSSDIPAPALVPVSKLMDNDKNILGFTFKDENGNTQVLDMNTIDKYMDDGKIDRTMMAEKSESFGTYCDITLSKILTSEEDDDTDGYCICSVVPKGNGYLVYSSNKKASGNGREYYAWTLDQNTCRTRYIVSFAGNFYIINHATMNLLAKTIGFKGHTHASNGLEDIIYDNKLGVLTAQGCFDIDYDNEVVEESNSKFKLYEGGYPSIEVYNLENGLSPQRDVDELLQVAAGMASIGINKPNIINRVSDSANANISNNTSANTSVNSEHKNTGRVPQGPCTITRVYAGKYSKSRGFRVLYKNLTFEDMPESTLIDYIEGGLAVENASIINNNGTKQIKISNSDIEKVGLAIKCSAVSPGGVKYAIDCYSTAGSNIKVLVDEDTMTEIVEQVSLPGVALNGVVIFCSKDIENTDIKTLKGYTELDDNTRSQLRALVALIAQTGVQKLEKWRPTS